MDTTPRRPGLSIVGSGWTTSPPSSGTAAPRSAGATRSLRLRSRGMAPGARAASPWPRAPYAAGPLVLGHRGSTSHGCRENSVEAVLAAMAAGADGVEVDVRLSRDGVLVCSHDAVVTTHLGRELVVSGSTASELLAGAARPDASRLATLAEVLSALRSQGAAHVVVEAKPVPDHVEAYRTARALAELLVPMSTGTLVTVSSFDAKLLAAVRRLVFGAPLSTALLGPVTESAVTVLRRAVDAGHDEVHLSLTALRGAPHAVRMAHQRGIPVTAWTVNGPELDEAVELGADAVITDDVASARAAMRQTATVLPLVALGETAC